MRNNLKYLKYIVIFSFTTTISSSSFANASERYNSAAIEQAAQTEKAYAINDKKL